MAGGRAAGAGLMAMAGGRAAVVGMELPVMAGGRAAGAGLPVMAGGRAAAVGMGLPVMAGGWAVAVGIGLAAMAGRAAALLCALRRPRSLRAELAWCCSHVVGVAVSERLPSRAGVQQIPDRLGLW